MLKNASEVTLVPKNIFFLKILNFMQSFVECKVSLADGFKVEFIEVSMSQGFLLFVQSYSFLCYFANFLGLV
jgi:hypothetical protein